MGKGGNRRISILARRKIIHREEPERVLLFWPLAVTLVKKRKTLTPETERNRRKLEVRS
jgi:hypothetical protein